MLTSKKGRPIKGISKRLRVSFTLEPSSVHALEEAALAFKLTKSEILDLAIDDYLIKNSLKTKKLPRLNFSKSKIVQFCLKQNIKKFCLFGSVLTENFNDNSDVDILVYFSNSIKPTLFDLARLEEELSLIFNNRKIDLRTEADLGKHLKEKVLKELYTIYEDEEF